MQMIPVSSSNIASIGYENGTLFVAFHHGGMYSYANVSSNVYQELMSAPSHGRYFAANIKGVYAYQKLH